MKTRASCMILPRMSRRKKSESIESSGHGCAWADCREPGNFKAPRSRRSVGDYQWFCEAHIVQFNKNWNYFEGMSQDEIYAYQKDATTGHRPTWRMDRLGGDIDYKMEEAFGRLFGDGKATFKANHSPISAKTRDALAQLDLEHPADKARVKSQYRELVKKYHPDVNRGNSHAEEMFKKVTIAYHHLMANYVEQ
ncbi:MAG: molecular chaperone DnaJ [Azospirillum brasilense]|nr:MAG: molecular chaperone DnaJ [Azospirillum brasilense]